MKFNYVMSVKKYRARIILTAIVLHNGPRIISESCGLKVLALAKFGIFGRKLKKNSINLVKRDKCLRFLIKVVYAEKNCLA